MSKGGAKCAVHACTNYKMQQDAKSFYRFPKNRELCKQWIAKTRRFDLKSVLEEKGPEYIYKCCVVCSDHFTQKDFRNKNLLSQGIFRDVVPSQNLFHDAEDPKQRPAIPKCYSRKVKPVDVSCKSTTGVQDATMDDQTKAEMAGHRCIVFGCNDGPKKSGKSVAYHMFPTNAFLREIWIRRCGRHEQFNADRSYVCSAHFKEEDYEKNLRAESLWARKFILKSTAIPTQHLGCWSLKGPSSNHAASNREQTRAAGPSNHRTKPIEEIYLKDVEVKIESEPDQGYAWPDIKTEEVDLEDNGLPEAQEEITVKVEELEEHPEVIVVADSENEGSADAEMEEYSSDRFEVYVCDDSDPEPSEGLHLLTENRHLLTENRDPVTPAAKTKYHTLLLNHNRLLRKVQELKSQLIFSQSLAASLKKKVTSLEDELRDAKQQTIEDRELKEGIGDVLSHGQINFGVLKKKHVVWTPDDISKAFTIRYLSSRCYVYLRDTLKYPLPGISSLQRWVSKVNLQEGILSGILRMMKIASYALSDFEKTVVLHLDEIRVRPVYEYDEIQDEVLGPHVTMQVIMARGLFSEWKQPVYVGFDAKITKKTLLDVVGRLHDATYNVVAVTSGCSKTNMALWNDLSVTTNATYILHPSTNNKIYFFADASRLLALLYESLMETGLTLGDGTVVTTEPLQELTTTETNSLNSSKIGSKSEETQRKIRLAKEFFALERAAALKQSHGESVGGFVEKIGLWLDLATSKLYGVRHDKFLGSFCGMFGTMRCAPGDTVDVFRTGVLISIKSLRQLFNHVRIKHSVNHIPTCRLNLDSLEELLAQVRVSEDQHPLPSPLSVVRKLRTLLLGTCEGQNSRQALRNEYVLSKVLSANVSIRDPAPNAIKDVDLKMLLTFTEEDHLKYLAALIATKFRDKYPGLVDESPKKRNYTLPFWLQHLACGDLTKASKYWLTQVRSMDKMFSFHHGADGKLKRCRKKNVTKRLVSYVTKRFKNVVPMELISEFVRQRTLVRIMHCNIKLTSRARGKRRKIGWRKKESLS